MNFYALYRTIVEKSKGNKTVLKALNEQIHSNPILSAQFSEYSTLKILVESKQKKEYNIEDLSILEEANNQLAEHFNINPKNIFPTDFEDCLTGMLTAGSKSAPKSQYKVLKEKLSALTPIERKAVAFKESKVLLKAIKATEAKNLNLSSFAQLCLEQVKKTKDPIHLVQLQEAIQSEIASEIEKDLSAQNNIINPKMNLYKIPATAIIITFNALGKKDGNNFTDVQVNNATAAKDLFNKIETLTKELELHYNNIAITAHISNYGFKPGDQITYDFEIVLKVVQGVSEPEAENLANKVIRETSQYLSYII